MASKKDMTTTKIRTAEALSPMLAVFHSIEGKPLQSVRNVYSDGSLDKLIFDFSPVLFTVVANENDDTISMTVEDMSRPPNTSGVDASDQAPWKSFVGRSFGWGWVTVNQQGYCDGLLMSFEGIVPQLVLNVVASSIRIGTITRTV